MQKQDKEILKIFQTEDNRKIEEDFASMFSENPNLRLFFINENQAYTDGKNIIVDPANDELFCDYIALKNTEEFLGLPQTFSIDRFIALKMITRAQNIHEALHIIYTNFPPDLLKDPRGNNKFNQMILSSISNVIEDCFIEAAGASEFDNMNLFLTFGRVSRLFSTTPAKGTIQRKFEEFTKPEEEQEIKPSEEELEIQRKISLIMELIDYFATMLLYPMVKLEEPSEDIKEYVDKTKELWLEGSICGEPDKRYEYTSKIFDIIEPLIPKINDKDIEKYEYVKKFISVLVGDEKNHSGKDMSINQFESKGRKAVITRKLFTDLDGNKIDDDYTEQYIYELEKFEEDKRQSIKQASKTTQHWEYTGGDLKASAMHKDIKIKVTYPKPNINMKKAYDNIYNRYKLNINSYNAKFSQLLKGNVDSKEDKFSFGSGIESKRLGDLKKRYWYRKVQGIDVPDIAILFLIDGSGSMAGAKNENAIKSSVILHEVLSKNGIEHAIVEHRAIFDEPLVKHKILVDFNYSKNDKYNILLLDADEGTREGLSLMWAKKYLIEHSHAEYKVIICISDGYPCHTANDNDDYSPPVSTKDTHNTARKIEKEGISIIGVALEEEKGDTECYEALKEVYDRVIDIDDMKHLTTQLLNLISKLFI